MGRATPLGPWETRVWPQLERPKKSFGVIAMNTGAKCDVIFTLRVVGVWTQAFGIGQRRSSRNVSPLPGKRPLDSMIAVVSLRPIVLPALCLTSIPFETKPFSGGDL